MNQASVHIHVWHLVITSKPLAKHLGSTPWTSGDSHSSPKYRCAKGTHPSISLPKGQKTDVHQCPQSTSSQETLLSTAGFGVTIMPDT